MDTGTYRKRRASSYSPSKRRRQDNEDWETILPTVSAARGRRGSSREHNGILESFKHRCPRSLHAGGGALLLLVLAAIFVLQTGMLLPESAWRRPGQERNLLGAGQLTAQEIDRRISERLSEGKVFPETHQLRESERKRILVTGGAGFVGSHLVDRLMVEGHEVIVVDNLFTGRKRNVQQWIGHPSFELVIHDVVEPIMLEVDQIYHLACPASPPHYQYNPVKTIKTSTQGTLNMLGLAKRLDARMLLTSTSEVYGDPQEHPQRETYWGNVNPVGPRACYDEGKRVAETMMYAYQLQGGLEVRVARIFNTFGPRMHPNDGRVVSNFIIQALQDKDITIYGDGSQTRSFQYVDDLVNGLISLMNGGYSQPVNIGNPSEYTVLKFAQMIKEKTGSKSKIVHLPATVDDPSKRKPDITVAKRELGWAPNVPVEEGIARTIEYFRKELEIIGPIAATGPDASKPGVHAT